MDTLTDTTEISATQANPHEDQGVWSAWSSFSESVFSGLNELSVAIVDTGTSLSESLNQVWTDLEWEEPATSDPAPSGRKQAHLETLATAAEGWDKKVREVWDAALDECSIHIDIPRLISKIRVENASGEVLFSAAENQEVEAQVLSFFQFLAKSLGDSVFVTMIESLTKAVAEKQVFTHSIKKMLEFPEAQNSPSVKLLKGMHQRILFPAYYYIKHLLRFPQMKDKAGAWQIIVTLDKDNTQIRHKKSQIVLEWMLNDHASSVCDGVVIEAEWELALIFNDATTMNLASVSTKVVDGFYDQKAIDPTLAAHYKNEVPALAPKTE